MSLKKHDRKRSPSRTVNRGPLRSAVATVEFAFILPILMTLTLGTMDVCSVIFLKEAAAIAAYEGARLGVNRNETNASASDRITDFLDNRGINYEPSTVIDISNPGFDNAETLESVTVTVRIPANGNLLIPKWVFSDLQIEAACTLRKEYSNEQ